MKENIFLIIDDNYDNLSKTHKKLADYVKENIHTVPFLTIGELGDKSGVSLASITRFTKELGFAGYTEFQKNVTRLIQKDVIPMKEIKNSILSEEDDSILKRTIDLNINALNNFYTEELEKNYNDSISMIKDCRKLFIMASRSSYTVGYYLYFMLRGFIENVELLTSGTDDISNRIAYVQKEDCLISISYARYTKSTYDITSYFHDLGCNIIAITDSYTAPIALKATRVLLAKNAADTYSFVTAITLANSLVTSLGRLDKKDTLEKLARQDKIALEKDIYL